MTSPDDKRDAIYPVNKGAVSSAPAGRHQIPNPSTATPEHVTLIRARRGWIAVDWRELWERRELLGTLVQRDIKVRYKQTVLGVAWAVLQPVFSMLIFTVIFGRFAKIPSEDVPYPVFVYAGLLPWTFFATGVTQAAQSLVNNEAVLTKIYLPRLFLPTAPIGGALVDLAISLTVFAVIMGIYGQLPGWGVTMLPVLVIMTVVAALGVGMLLSALTVSYRDFRFVVPFMIQALMYVSPVIYPVTMIPTEYRWLLALNPLSGIIDGFRAACLARPFDMQTLSISAAMSLTLFIIGAFYFKKTERRFADIA